MGREMIFLLVKAEQKLRASRSMVRLLNSDAFFNLWNLASPQTREKIRREVEKTDLEGLRRVLYSITPLEDLPIRDLRNIARDKAIRNYCRLSRDQLIERIEDEEKTERQ